MKTFKSMAKQRVLLIDLDANTDDEDMDDKQSVDNSQMSRWFGSADNSAVTLSDSDLDIDLQIFEDFIQSDSSLSDSSLEPIVTQKGMKCPQIIFISNVFKLK